MERNKLLTLAVIGLLLLNMATLGFLVFRKPPHDKRPERGGPTKIIVERLKLDEAQQKKHRELAKVHHEAFVKLKEKSQELHHDYYALLTTDNVNNAQADSLSNLIAANQNEIDRLNFNHFMDIKAICNPEQKLLFNEFADEISRFFSGPPPPQGRE